MPNITGTWGGGTQAEAGQTASGAFTYESQPGAGFASGGIDTYYKNGLNFDASRVSSTYQDNAHVRPLSLVTSFLIRY